MKKKLNISLDEDVKKALKELAKEDNKTVSQWITDVVIQHTKELEKQRKIQMILSILGRNKDIT